MHRWNVLVTDHIQILFVMDVAFGPREEYIITARNILRSFFSFT